jgi:hypothetical protein
MTGGRQLSRGSRRTRISHLFLELAALFAVNEEEDDVDDDNDDDDEDGMEE